MQEKINKLKKLKLLFVEDEEGLLEIISDILSKLDANFLTSQNGEEALELINSNPDIDVLITDINMPIMNGLTLIKTLKENNFDKPIIVMSAHTEIDYIEKAKKMGVHDYLLKPFDFIKFIDLITRLEKN